MSWTDTNIIQLKSHIPVEDLNHFRRCFAWMSMNNIHRCVDHHHIHSPMYTVTLLHYELFTSCIHHQFIHSHSPSICILPSFLVDLLHINIFASNNCTPPIFPINVSITQHVRSIHPNYTRHHNPRSNGYVVKRNTEKVC